MSTRSTIALESKDGTIRAVYCHWDGHPEHNGRILLDGYTNRAKTAKLIDGGAISVLDVNVEPDPKGGVYYDWNDIRGNSPALKPANGKHNFEHRQVGATLYYVRDRGDKDNLAPSEFKDFKEFSKSKYLEEWVYLQRADGKWWFRGHEVENFTRLTLTAIKKHLSYIESENEKWKMEQSIKAS